MCKTDSADSDELKLRQHWMNVCAKSGLGELEKAWEALSQQPRYKFLRQPETGTILVRGRAGGTGQRFNLGEMTVTRCVVQLDNGVDGYSYVAGMDHRHAELAAVFDALLQAAKPRDELWAIIIEPLEAKLAQLEHAESSETASTRVEFLTMVRGE